MKPLVRVLRKPRNDLSVVHPPAVLPLEVLAEISALERCGGAHLVVPRWVGVVVVDAEEERIGRFPHERERLHGKDRIGHTPLVRL
jgi:hypothetical protein